MVLGLFFASRNHEEAKGRYQNCTKGTGSKKTAETFNFILLKFVRRFDLNIFCIKIYLPQFCFCCFFF